MSEGWIKLHRKMLECPVVMIDADHLAIWVYLLLKATHRDYPIMFGGNKIVLKAGQLVTGRKAISSVLNISESKVNRVLLLLESDEQIERKVNNKGTLITIVNWSKYQVDDLESEQQTDSKRTASEQQVNTNKNIRSKKKEEINIKADESPVFIELPLNDGSTHSVTEKVVCELKELYPSADVEQELRNMKGWLNGNPTKRKTKTGINRFINSWLAREQNKGGKVTPVKKSNSFAEINKPGFDESALEKMLGV